MIFDVKQETRNLKLEGACFEPTNKKVFAKNLPVVAERDSFFGRRTKEDRRQKFKRFAKTEGLHDWHLPSLFFEDNK